MKKLSIWIVVLALMLGMTACGGGEEGGSAGGDETTAAQGGDSGGVSISETYSVGEFDVDVPEGWIVASVYPAGDMTKDPETDIIQLFKDPSDEAMAAFNSPGLNIRLYAAEDAPSLEQSRGFYDDAVDIEPFTVGDVTWSGYSSASGSYPFIYIAAEMGADAYQIMVMSERQDGTITTADADVQAILASLTATPSAG